ncbi:hypothetical protein [Chryseobacterium indoltheticum]|uniref:hypothetical protein n=1 Tax=Chryseobacterium indoltheticum TaxID=254 RepID=UPI003F49359A
MEKILTKAFVTMKENKQVFKVTGSVKVCLFINVSDISLKLFSDKKFKKKYKAITYDSHHSRITLTEYLEKFNIKCIVLETSNITHLYKDIANEIVAARNKGIAVYDAHEFYEHVNRRIPLIRLKNNEYLVDDIFTIGQKQEKFNLKRLIDILVSVVLLPIVIPLVIFGFILVKLTSHGSVLFLRNVSEKIQNILQYIKSGLWFPSTAVILQLKMTYASMELGNFLD